MWRAIEVIGGLAFGNLHFRRKGLIEPSRWAWWREFHERMRRYPTAQEVDNWMSEQTGAAAP